MSRSVTSPPTSAPGLAKLSERRDGDERMKLLHKANAAAESAGAMDNSETPPAAGAVAVEMKGSATTTAAPAVLQPEKKVGNELAVLEAAGIAFFVGLIASSSYFAYHSIGAVETLLEGAYGWDASDIGFLFTAYSLPNTAGAPILFGLLIKVHGHKRIGAVLLFFVAMGPMLCALATSLNMNLQTKYVLMVAGRVVLGIGSEAMITWQQTTVAFWFGGTDRNSMAMGCALAVQQVLGSAGSFFILAWLAGITSLEFSMWFVVMWAGCSIVFLIIYCLMERTYVKDYLLKKKSPHSEVRLFPMGFLCCGCPYELVSLTEVKTVGGDEAEPDKKAKVDDHHVPDPDAKATGNDVTSWQILRAMPATFWLQNVIILWIDTILYTSANFFPYWLETDKGYDSVTAGRCTALLYLAIVFAPFAGGFADRYGQKLKIQMVASAGCAACFLMLFFTNISPWVLIPCCGWFFSWIEQNSYVLLSMTWAKVDDEFPNAANAIDCEGIGFGIMGGFLNGGLTALPPFVGYLFTKTGTYNYQNLLFAGFMVMGVIFSLALDYMDHDGVLDMTASEVEERNKHLAAERSTTKQKQIQDFRDFSQHYKSAHKSRTHEVCKTGAVSDKNIG